MVVFGILVSIFLFIRLLVVIANNWSGLIIETHHQSVSEKLEILIPARNEAGNLPRLLEDLQQLDTERYTIRVLDDHSKDGTADIVRSYQSVMPNLHLLKGKPLPKGWLGKNWACHQLGESSGELYLLFLDADVRIDPGLLDKSLVYLKQRNLALLSLFPRQILQSTGERIVVPIVYGILVTLLPLQLVEKSRLVSFSAANGQFMLFDGSHYRIQLWHRLLKKEKVEDIEIMKHLKRKGLKGAVAFSGKRMTCRMYHGFNEAIDGFSKNFLAFFGNSPFLAFTYIILGALGFWLLIPFFPLWSFGGLLIEIGVIRTLASHLNGYSVLRQGLFSPVQMFVIVYLGLVAFIRQITGKNKWKGRYIG